MEGDGGTVAVRAEKEKSVLGALALNAGTVLSSEALIDAVWGDGPPASARKTLQTYVVNLRRALGPAAIRTEAPGYVLCVGPEDVDALRFRRLVDEGEGARRDLDHGRASAVLSEAVDLWRGPPFPWARPGSVLGAEAVRLTEIRLTAVECRVDADLASGRHDALVGELEVLVRQHPFRERLWGQLITALYRCGRQADALSAYQRASTALREELGLEPRNELRTLERAVLDHDAVLDWPAGEVVRTDPPAHPLASIGARPDTTAYPPVRYAECEDGVRIAYQVVGEGPIDVIAVPGFVSHLDIWWDAPTDRLVRRLASFSRLILFDKRGSGLSDRPPTVDLEHWVEDTRAVLDDVGSHHAVVLGISAGAPTALLFAASNPDRTRGLVLFGGFARGLRAVDFPFGWDAEAMDSVVEHLHGRWGTGVMLKVYAPSAGEDPRARAYWARYQRISASPTAAVTFLRALAEVDVRHALGVIDAPTLVLHATGDRLVPIEGAREMAAHIPNATLVELRSEDHLIWLSDSIGTITGEIEKFVAGIAPSSPRDRVLATVLLADLGRQEPATKALLDDIVSRFRGRPLPDRPGAAFEGPARAIRCALVMAAELGGVSNPVGIGLHSGECEVVDGSLRGVAVDLAASIAQQAPPGGVLVSRTVKDLVVGSDIEFEDRGRRSLRGVPDEWDLYAVTATS